MQNEKSSTPPSDELDIGKLFSRIGEGIRGGWLNLMRFLAMMRRVPMDHRASFLFIIFASIVMGFILSFFLQKNFYESSMILSSNYLNKRLAESTIGKLNLLAKEKNKSGLAKALALPDSMADNIIELSVKPFVAENDVIELEVLKEQLRTAQTAAANKDVIDQVINRIEIENRHAFEISVRTLSPSTIPNFQNAIISYFRNNTYIKKRIEINKENLELRKKKLRGDLNKLDSLKVVMYENYRNMAAQSRAGSNNVILSDKAVTDPIDIYKQDQDIYNQLQEVNRQLYLQPDFELVEGFTEFSEPANASLWKMLLYSALIGVGVAYFDVGLRKFNNYLASLG